MTRADTFTNTIDQAAAFERANTEPRDDRDHDTGEVSELGHDHRAGLLCILCAFQAALKAAGDEYMVCDCAELYAPEDGCSHGLFLCGDCLHRCRECVQERADDARGDARADAW